MAPRRSPRLNPQIHATEEGVGIARRLSPRLHTLIQASEEGAGVTLHSQTRSSADGPTRRRRRRRRGTSPASLPDDDDMLREILLRLPSQPSSLPRLSAVCKHWRCIVGDPKFHRQFYAHHRKPPLLGVFTQRNQRRGIMFSSILDPPDCIPPRRFSLGCYGSWDYSLLDCRHGLILVRNRSRTEVVVCDPITSEKRLLAIPPEFMVHFFKGAVLCAADDQGHTHGGCHSSPFKVVLMSLCGDAGDTLPIACVYSSETGVWSNIISTPDRCGFFESNPGVLLGNVLYWSSMSECIGIINLLDGDESIDDIIEFDLDRQSLGVIKGPPGLNGSPVHQIIQTEDGAVGLTMLSHGRLEVWQRKLNCHGGATWLLQKTVEMHTVLGLPPQVEGWMRGMAILGYDEDNCAIFVCWGGNVYMVQLMSMQLRKLFEIDIPYNCYPFSSFFAPAGAVEMVPDYLD